MPERIYKLQPDRTIALRGFNDFGASAAIHSATPSSFKVSGVFRDPADFAVVVIHDADNFYEHPSVRYLPDFDFNGLTLNFDVRFTNLMPLDSPKYPTIDWPYLDVIRPDSTRERIRLSQHMQQSGGSLASSSGQFTIQDNWFVEYDRLTLWYLNFAFDYMVPKVQCAYTFTGQGAGTVHSITVAGTAYTYTETGNDTNSSVAAGIVAALLTCPEVTARQGDGTPEWGLGNQVNLRCARSDGGTFDVSSTAAAETYTLRSIGASTIAAALAAQIDAVEWDRLEIPHGLSASADGNAVTITATRPGAEGNMLRMYAVWKNDRLRADKTDLEFADGVSDVTWRVSLDFSALQIPSIREMWLTLAPALTNGAEYTSEEWEAEFTNWSLSGPEERRMLQVAGPGSVRVEDTDTLCTYTGDWTVETGFFSGGEARRTSTINDSVSVRYYCASEHDLWVGTSLHGDRGVAGVIVDEDAETGLDCLLDPEPSVNTRRKVRDRLAAGYHTVKIRLKAGQFFYFDFIEAAVPSDIHDPRDVLTNFSPALDYSTDHTYKLSPSRLLWIFDKLGYAGPMNEYIGVFWWNQRKRVDAVIPSATVLFTGEYKPNDQIFLTIGEQSIGKTVLGNESNESIAKHFLYFINATLVGVWASAEGNRLTITNRSPSTAYSYDFTVSQVIGAESTGHVEVISGSLTGGIPGSWVLDESQTPALNAGARAWHADLYAGCHARGREIVTAVSMELVLPPAGYPARFPDGATVETAVGFAGLKSTHCGFNSAMLGYQKRVFEDLAGLMSSAGLTPHLQFGEFTWWYFPRNGMAYHDSETNDLALAALGRELYPFSGPDDDPLVNGGADAVFLRNRLRDHVAALADHIRSLYPNAVIELLFPYDVNHPFPAGIHNLGGRLNRFINFPAEWEHKETSGLDRLKVEALDFGAWSRDLDLALTAIRFPLDLGWHGADLRHLIPVFTAGYPWEKEVQRSVALGVDAINVWAFDHICIYNLMPQPSQRTARSQLIS